VIYLDTHVLIYLWLADTGKLSRDARKAIERNDVMASAATVLEMEMLHEIGRLKPSASTVIYGLAGSIGLRVCGLPFRTVVDFALAEGWTRDPFDRMIVANAKVAHAPLITRDQRIAEHYSRVVW
jgi:PIN domain nuclease of toxin-antitoxin system